MSGFRKIVSLTAAAGAALGAERAAALTTVSFDIPANAPQQSPIFIGGAINAQYGYGGAAFKTASTFVPYGSSLTGSLVTTPGIDANDIYGFNSVEILSQSGATLATDVYLRLKFDVAGESQLGYASFNTAGTLTAISYQAAPAAVPEPAAWTMLVTGFGAAGAALRRRRREARLAVAA